MPEGVPCLGIYENQGSSGPSAYLNAHAVKALDIRESECVRAVRVKGEHYLKRVGATTARPGCSLYSNRPGAAGRTLGTSILRKAGVTPGVLPGGRGGDRRRTVQAHSHGGPLRRRPAMRPIYLWATGMSLVLISVFGVIVFESCSGGPPVEVPEKPAPVDVPGYSLEIVRIRGCESYAYVAGMICHAGDCDNPIHHGDQGSH